MSNSRYSARKITSLVDFKKEIKPWIVEAYGSALLLESTMIGNRSLFYELIALLVNVNVQFSRRREESALHWASLRGDGEMVDALLSQGAIIDARDGENVTPLMRAAWHGHATIVEKLIAAKADIHAKSIYQRTALTYGASYGYWGPVQCLIEAKAIIDDPDEDGKTALMFAAEDCHYQKTERTDYARVIDSLVQAKADVNKADQWGNTSLKYAMAKGPAEVITGLIDAKADVNQTDIKGNSVMANAIEYVGQGYRDITHLLWGHCRTVDTRNKAQQTMLMLAAQSDRSHAILKSLLAKGADPKAVCLKGYTALHYAIRAGAQNNVHWLLCINCFAISSN